MATTTNPITGDLIKSRPISQKYLDNYDKIFSRKPNEETNSNNLNTTPNDDLCPGKEQNP